MSTASSSMQRRRYTITTAVQQKNEYPEHLNPFREDNDDGKTNNKYSISTFGRRNSRLTSSLRLKSWFPSKSSKPDESDTTDSQKSAKPKEKFMTLTPKISRQIRDVFTHKRSKNKTDGGLAPIPQYVATQKPLSDQLVGEEFKLAPRARRERFSTRATPATPPADATQLPSAETVGLQPPVPLPRTILPRAKPKISADETMEVSASAAVDSSAATRLILNISEDDGKYARQGARPKKKRQAPLPPTKTTLPDSSSSQLISSTELSETVSLSASINSDCPSPVPSLASETHMDVVPSSACPNTSRTEDNNDDRLV